MHRYPRGRRFLPPPRTEPEARSSPAPHGAEVFPIRRRRRRALHHDFSAHPLLHRDFSAAATSAPPIAPYRVAGSSRLLPSPSQSDWFIRRGCPCQGGQADPASDPPTGPSPFSAPDTV
ncbi:Os08g0327501 [Oryza sativa Japonica Group]|uniref:Os08g0327501 protein n=2 Tax=Oryza sativa subsp. japonica TaxID=39947 RepID=C7J695_ORYSJ|nr:hypothetical protein OsJ_26897 [Oryza sativa Japonica Group]BAH94248.1 Os08g0327501 [Oryza sativa Japonica Group]BAT04917.1 Os08g0327501 [Oryza sativa Japonica Group]|eukprot:NP_001175520.1 Os08g0327501 [Oryza sativa Japonica Group]